MTVVPSAYSLPSCSRGTFPHLHERRQGSRTNWFPLFFFLLFIRVVFALQRLWNCRGPAFFPETIVRRAVFCCFPRCFESSRRFEWTSTFTGNRSRSDQFETSGSPLGLTWRKSNTGVVKDWARPSQASCNIVFPVYSSLFPQICRRISEQFSDA